MIDKERLKKQIDELDGNGMVLFAAETNDGNGLTVAMQGKGGEFVAAIGTIISELAGRSGAEPAAFIRHLALGLRGVGELSNKQLGDLAIELAIVAGIADMPTPKGGVN
jgi:hypothetical protein